MGIKGQWRWRVLSMASVGEDSWLLVRLSIECRCEDVYMKKKESYIHER